MLLLAATDRPEDVAAIVQRRLRAIDPCGYAGQPNGDRCGIWDIRGRVLGTIGISAVDWAIWQNVSTAPDQVLIEHPIRDYKGTCNRHMMSVTYRRTTTYTECDSAVSYPQAERINKHVAAVYRVE